MSLIVKTMSREDCADDDTRKAFSLNTGVLKVEFGREVDNRPIAYMWYDGDMQPEKFYPAGNVYVMNEAGRTIASFGYEPPPGSPVPHYADSGKPVDATAYAG